MKKVKLLFMEVRPIHMPFWVKAPLWIASLPLMVLGMGVGLLSGFCAEV